MSAAAKHPGDRWWAWALLVAVVVAAFAIGWGPAQSARNDADRVQAIAETLKCPVCSGESVADSDASASREMRAEIARQVQEGRTDEEIRRYMVERFGEDTLLTPSGDGIEGLVWVLPVVVIAVAGTAVGLKLNRWHRESAAGASTSTVSEDDEALVEAARRRTTTTEVRAP